MYSWYYLYDLPFTHNVYSVRAIIIALTTMIRVPTLTIVAVLRVVVGNKPLFRSCTHLHVKNSIEDWRLYNTEEVAPLNTSEILTNIFPEPPPIHQLPPIYYIVESLMTTRHQTKNLRFLDEIQIKHRLCLLVIRWSIF